MWFAAPENALSTLEVGPEDVERVGVAVTTRIPVGGGDHAGHRGASWDRGVVHLDVFGWLAHDHLHRRRVTKVSANALSMRLRSSRTAWSWSGFAMRFINMFDNALSVVSPPATKAATRMP